MRLIVPGWIRNGVTRLPQRLRIGKRKRMGLVVRVLFRVKEVLSGSSRRSSEGGK